MDPPGMMTNILMTDATLKACPTLVQYLIEKGKSGANIASYLGSITEQLGSYTDNEGVWTEAAMGLLSIFGAVDTQNNGGTEDYLTNEVNLGVQM